MHEPTLHLDLEDLLRQDDFVRAICRAVIGPGPEADDAAQDAWVRALAAPPPDRTARLGWLRAVARSAVFSRRRRDVARAARERNSAAPAPVPTPDRILEREELRRRIVEAVLGLPERYRTPVLLRHFEELEPVAIAARLGVPVRTVWTRLHRARLALRERLDADDPRGARRLGALAGGPAVLSAAPAPAAVVAGGLLFGKGVVATTAAAILLSIGALVLRSGSPPPVGPLPGAPAGPAFGERDETASVPVRASEPGERGVAGAADRAVVRDGEGGTPAFRGRVVDAAGVPLEEVAVRWDGDVRSATRTDREGRFELRSPEAIVTLRFAREGFVPTEVEATLASAVDVVLRRGVEVRGTVRDDRTGAPVAGARVAIGAARASTGADGAFRLFAPPLSDRLAIEHDDYVEWIAEPFDASVGPLDVRLPPISGAADEVRYVRVVAAEDGRPIDTATFGTSSSRSLGGGLHSVGFLRGARSLGASVEAKDRVGVRIEERTARGRVAHDPIEVRLERPAAVRGTVRDVEGAPVEGARIRAEVEVLGLLHGHRAGPGHRRATATTGADGVFEVRNLLPSAKVRIRVEHERYARASVQVPTRRAGAEGDPTEVALTLDAGGSIAGVVVRAEDGRPIAGATVRVGTAHVASTDDEGRFELDGMSGTPFVEVRADGYATMRRHVSRPLGAGSSLVDLRIPLARGGSIAGRVVSADGRPASGAAVLAFRPRLDDPTAVSVFRPATADAATDGFRPVVRATAIEADAEGRFVVGDLTPGTYALSAAPSGCRPTDDPRRAVDVHTGRSDVVLTAHGPTGVTVRVVDAGSGAPLPRFRFAGPSRRGEVTNARGEVFVEALPGAPFSVAAAAPGHATQVSSGLRIGDGEWREAELRLPRASAREGTLTDARGRPIADATLVLRPNGAGEAADEWFDAEVVTDSDGRFTLSDAAPGTWDVVSCRRSGGAGAATRTLSVEPAHLALTASTDPAPVIRLVASPPAGQALVRGFVEVREDAAEAFVVLEPHGIRAVVDGEGRFSVEAVPAGPVAFRLEQRLDHPVWNGIVSRAVGEAEVPDVGTLDVDLRPR